MTERRAAAVADRWLGLDTPWRRHGDEEDGAQAERRLSVRVAMGRLADVPRDTAVRAAEDAWRWTGAIDLSDLLALGGYRAYRAGLCAALEREMGPTLYLYANLTSDVYERLAYGRLRGGVVVASLAPVVALPGERVIRLAVPPSAVCLMGHPVAGEFLVAAARIRPGMVSLAGWDEALHPRAKDGRFGEKEGAAVHEPVAVYHGTPHEFDKFDISKVGAGEGHQAFGWGLYVAGNPDVANYYAKAIHDDAYYDKVNSRMSELARIMDAHRGGEYGKFKDQAGRDAAAEYDRLMGERSQKNQQHGVVYTSTIPKEAVDRMLDWDKEMSAQAPSVQKASEEVLGKTDPDMLQRWKATGSWDHVTGKNVYERITETINRTLVHESIDRVRAGGESQKATSQLLDKAGVPGIRYLDAMSRGKDGTLTQNYVVFDDKLLQVKSKKHLASAFIDAFALAWVEELHPRDTSGRFTDGSDVREDHPKSAPPTEPQTSDAKPVLAPAPAPLPAVVEKAVETDENTLGALRGHEEAFVVDASGKEVMHLTGTVDSIPVTEDMDHGLLKDAVFTHNHPGVYAYGGVVNGLSVEDVVTAAKHDVLEMRAVSDGVVHVIERPEKGWPSTVALQEAAKAESDKIYADFSTRIAKGEAQIDQARQQHYHILWNRLAPEFGFRYAREVRPGATARILDVPAEMSLSSRSAGKLIDDSELAEMDARYLALAGKAVSLAAGFDETAHPRDEHGRWASKDDDDDVPLLSASDNPRSVVTRTADGAKLTIRTPGGADVDDLLPLTHDLPTTIAKKWFAGTSADGVQVDMKWDRWHYTSPEHPNDPVATLAISAKGGPFAHVERTISKLADGSVWVNHDKLFVEPDQQGHSLGVRLIDNAFRWYRTLGEHVTVTAFANATRGAYAWARGGFVPVKDDHLADTLKEIGKRVTALRVSADIKERLRSALNPDDKQALWKVADARWYGQNIGKQLLEGLSWNAEMRLDDKTQMDRWNRYVASKLPEKSRG